MFRLYSPQRLWQVFTVLLTLYLLIRKRERFVVFRPLTPPRLLRRITELGTSFVKLAQVLATRSDFFPPPYLAALRDLHDALPPMKASVRDAVFKRAFPMDPFAYFDPLPIASASIGQVHAGPLAEFTEQMFTIFENDALDSASMQELAFDVLDRTRNLPFKLPQEAIYILRVSSIIEGLGTTYIENFNGIKDILPILQRNIPRALGVKATILETIADEFRQLPADIMALRGTLRRADRGELAVLLSPLQLDAIRQQTAQTLKPVITGFLLLFSALFVLLLDPGYGMAALSLFILGAVRIVFR